MTLAQAIQHARAEVEAGHAIAHARSADGYTVRAQRSGGSLSRSRHPLLHVWDPKGKLVRKAALAVLLGA